jgi:arsenate reductase
VGSRAARLDILRERGVDVRRVEYLKSRSTAATLERFLGAPRGAADGPPPEGQALPRARPRRGGAFVTRDQVRHVLLQHPELMERPVVIRGGRAVIAGRPRSVLEILE